MEVPLEGYFLGLEMMQRKPRREKRPFSRQRRDAGAILLSVDAVVRSRETMASLSMSAASLSFGRNVADAQRLRISVRARRRFHGTDARMRFIHFAMAECRTSKTTRG